MRLFRCVWIKYILLLWHIGHTHSQGCPAFWTRVGRHCYRLVSSMDFDTLGFPTIYHARFACKQHGGDLAHIESMTAEQKIYGIMRNMSLDSVPRKIYIGLIAMGPPGSEFTWLNGQSFHYQDWGMGEPGNPDEHCVVVKSPYKTWKPPEETEWHDYPCCSQTNIRHALCSREVGMYDEDMPDVMTAEFIALCNTVNECDSNPCQNNGVCIDHVMSYTCNCSYGYQGSHCQQEVLCPVPDLDHAHLGDVMNRTEYELESLVSVTCEQGYGFSERLVPPIKQYNCTKQGWQEIIEEEIECPTVPSWSGLQANASSRFYGDAVDYVCEEGMEFEDKEEMKTSKCNLTGDWDPPLMECIEKESSRRSLREKTPSEASGAVVFGVFGLAFMITELCVLVLMDVNTLRLHMIVGYKNIKSLVLSSTKKQTRTGFRPVPVQL